MNSKELGTCAMLWVAADLVERGYVVSQPFGDNAPYDLIVDRNGKLERIQIKMRSARHGRLDIELYTMQYDSSGNTNNRTKMVKYENDFEWIAAVDKASMKIYYVPASEFANITTMTLRLLPAGNNQKEGVRMAEQFTNI